MPELSAAFVRLHARLAPVAFVPEVRLHQADEPIGLWELTEGEFRSDRPPPFWAFAWAGGQALARYVTDHPELVAGRRVLDLASGSGLVAIAAARAGAAAVRAVEIDELAVAAVALNAEANGVRVDAELGDILDGDAGDAEVVLAGDVFYSEAMARRVLRFLLRAARAGAPGAGRRPGPGVPAPGPLRELAAYDVPVPEALESVRVKRTTVWRAASPPRRGPPASVSACCSGAGRRPPTRRWPDVATGAGPRRRHPPGRDPARAGPPGARRPGDLPAGQRAGRGDPDPGGRAAGARRAPVPVAADPGEQRRRQPSGDPGDRRRGVAPGPGGRAAAVADRAGPGPGRPDRRRAGRRATGRPARPDLAADLPLLVLARLVELPDAPVGAVKDFARAALELFWAPLDADRQQALAAEVGRFHRVLRDFAGRRWRAGRPAARAPGTRPTWWSARCSSCWSPVRRPPRSSSPCCCTGWPANPRCGPGCAAGTVAVADVVEEGLRLEPPIVTWRRVAATDTTLGGTPVPAGSTSCCGWPAPAGTRRSWTSPDEFRPGQRGSRRHLAFGAGAHRCVGDAAGPDGGGGGGRRGGAAAGRGDGAPSALVPGQPHLPDARRVRGPPLPRGHRADRILTSARYVSGRAQPSPPVGSLPS